MNPRVSLAPSNKFLTNVYETFGHIYKCFFLKKGLHLLHILDSPCTYWWNQPVAQGVGTEQNPFVRANDFCL